MKNALVIAFLLVMIQRPLVSDRVIGLLSLPEVFGDGPCEAFVPSEIALYAAPDAQTVIGSIRVDKHWKLPECEGLTVNVHRTRTGAGNELPTREHGYEEPAAIVVEQQGRWFKIRVSDGAAWLRASDRDQYFSVEQLLSKGLTHITSASDGRLFATPGANRARPDAVAAGRNVHVREFRTVAGELWAHVDILSHSICESRETPRTVAQGWMRVHAPSGEPTIWFYSRGC